MAKKTKKVEPLETIETPPSEIVKIKADVTTENVGNAVKTDNIQNIGSVELESVSQTTVTTSETKGVEKVEESTSTSDQVYVRKIGKITVSQSFLNSNPTFFTWLHKQGYAILSRNRDPNNDHITFVLDGDDLIEVVGDSIPEYNVHVAGSRLSITKK